MVRIIVFSLGNAAVIPPRSAVLALHVVARISLSSTCCCAEQVSAALGAAHASPPSEVHSHTGRGRVHHSRSDSVIIINQCHGRFIKPRLIVTRGGRFRGTREVMCWLTTALDLLFSK